MTELTKETLDQSLDGFKKTIRAESKAGTLEAIQEQKKSCVSEFDERYTKSKECSKIRDTCKKEIYDRIGSSKNRSNGGSNRGNPMPYNRYDYGRDNPGDDKDDPSINIVFRHFKNNKIGYGAGLIAVIEFIILIITFVQTMG